MLPPPGDVSGRSRRDVPQAGHLKNSQNPAVSHPASTRGLNSPIHARPPPYILYVSLSLYISESLALPPRPPSLSLALCVSLSSPSLYRAVSLSHHYAYMPPVRKRVPTPSPLL
ncbi:unnamed protein product [Gadus morhua 'NCC']